MENITLTLQDGVLRVSPVPLELKKELTYWHVILSGTYKKRSVTGEYRRLYTLNSKISETGILEEELIASIGLTSRVYHVLSNLGHGVNVFDFRTPLPVGDLSRTSVKLRPYQVEGVGELLNNMGGIMACPTGWGKSYIQAALIDCFSYDDLKLRGTPLSVIAAPEKDLVRQLYNNMVDILGEKRQVGMISSDGCVDSSDIIVSTLDSLQHIDPQEIGLLLLDEVHTAATASRIPKILAADKAVKWGFSATPSGRFDNADLSTEALVGPIVYEKTYEDGVKAGALVPIKVFWLKAPIPPIGVDAVHRYVKHVSIVRHGLIHNDNLNDLIIDILNRIPGNMQTLCMVQLLEHVDALLSLDDNLQYVHGTTTAKKLKKTIHSHISPISAKGRKEIYNKFRDGEISKLISTSIYQQGVNFPNLEVLINLGGGGSDIAAGQIPGRASRNIKGKNVSYIVDIWNDWDIKYVEGRKRYGTLYKADRSRSRVYQKLGFEEVWVDTVDELPFIGEDNV